MEPSAELVALIHQIRNAASPLHRLKLVALAWRSLGGMATVDRMAVAKAIGVEGAERLVEQLGSHGGVSPSLLLGAIQRAEKADPAELERLLRELKDPAERAALISEATAELERWAVPEPATTAGEPAPSTPVGAPRAAPAIPEAPSPPEPSPPPVPPPTAVTPPPPAILEVPPTVPLGATPAARQQPQRQAPAPSAVPPRRLAPITKPARQTARTQGTPRERRGERHRTAAPPRRAGHQEQFDLAAALREAGGTFERLRLLSAHAGDTAGLQPSALAAIVAVFQPGWARRRALEALIRARAIDRADTLLALLKDADPRTATWAISALVACTSLSAEELERLEAAAPRHPLPRHLSHRNARAG